MITRRAIVSAAIVIAIVSSGAYYYLYGREYVFRFTEAQLHQALAERLPIEKSYFVIFLITLDNPRIKLVEGSDRVNAGLDITFNVRLSDEPAPLGGSIDASGGIRYDASEGQFFMTDPKVERLEVEGIPEQYSSRVAGALTSALGEYYSAHPIYTLDGSDAKQAAARLVLRSVVVERQELVVTLGIGD
jgi:Protein of unknown function (DUF1439)